MSFLGATLDVFDWCYSRGSHLLSLSGSLVTKEDCYLACDVRRFCCIPSFAKQTCASSDYSVLFILLGQVHFMSACGAVLFNEFVEGDANFECVLHKDCGRVVIEQTNVTLIG